MRGGEQANKAAGLCFLSLSLPPSPSPPSLSPSLSPVDPLVVCDDGKLRVEDDLNPVKLKAIAEEVGQDWKMLGRYLGLKEKDIQAIDHANSRDLHEAAYQILVR